MTILILLVLMTGPTANAADHPAPKIIPEEMSCGVCGMYPAKYIKWQSQIIFTDGSMVPFDGCKDMFKFILNMSEYDHKHSRDNITAIWVKDFESGEWLDGNKAVYVIGSKMMGPMGVELIPFSNKTNAMKFKSANEGMIKTLADISMEDIKKLGMGGMGMKGMKKGMKMDMKKDGMKGKM